MISQRDESRDGEGQGQREPHPGWREEKKEDSNGDSCMQVTMTRNGVIILTVARPQLKSGVVHASRKTQPLP